MVVVSRAGARRGTVEAAQPHPASGLAQQLFRDRRAAPPGLPGGLREAFDDRTPGLGEGVAAHSLIDRQRTAACVLREVRQGPRPALAREGLTDHHWHDRHAGGAEAGQVEAAVRILQGEAEGPPRL